MVEEFREAELVALFPGLAVVVGDVDHVVGIYCSERGETVSDDGEERHEDVVYDVDYVVLF